jgi:quercetin dioxygenase-like cupin family protein
MRRFPVFQSVMAVILLGILALQTQPGAFAQEATPAVEGFMPEGITFEPVAFATGLALPAPGEVSVSRIGFDPGTGFPIDEEDPTYALAVVESGALTIRLDRPLMVTRAGALATAMAEEEAGGAPANEEIAAGQEATLQAGDTALFPPDVGGEIGNDGQDRAVVLVVFVGPPEDMTGEATPAP